MSIFSAPAQATTVYAASVSGCTASAATGFVPSPVSLNTISISGATDCIYTTGFGQGSAAAASSSSGLSAFSTYRHSCPCTASGFGARASLNSEFIITGPGPTASIAIGFDISYRLAGGQINSEAVVISDIGVSGVGSGRVVYGTNPNSPRLISGFTGMVFPGGGERLVLSGTVPVGTPVLLTMSLEASTAAFSDSDVAIANAGNTLTLARSGPVFILPDGFSVLDIPEIGLFGNQFLPNGPGGNGGGNGEVPEPATWAMLSAGVGALILRSERASRS